MLAHALAMGSSVSRRLRNRSVMEEEDVNGLEIVAEYERLKAHIKADTQHTNKVGDVFVVKGSFIVPEGAGVVEKIRGGKVGWDDDFLNTPCTHVDDDPLTYDRISVERRLEREGKLLGTSSIIFSETSEADEHGRLLLVVEKLERYSQETPLGTLTGERFARVSSPSGAVLEAWHHHAKEATPAQ